MGYFARGTLIRISYDMSHNGRRPYATGISVSWKGSYRRPARYPSDSPASPPIHLQRMIPRRLDERLFTPCRHISIETIGQSYHISHRESLSYNKSRRRYWEAKDRRGLYFIAA